MDVQVERGREVQSEDTLRGLISLWMELEREVHVCPGIGPRRVQVHGREHELRSGFQKFSRRRIEEIGVAADFVDRPRLDLGP